MEMMGGFAAYEKASEEWEDPDVHGVGGMSAADYKAALLGKSQISRVRAVAGPFDGEELTCRPGDSEVLLPAAFGKTGDMHGKVIYRREGDVMVYVGQPDQTDETHTDEDEDDEDEPPSLILP